MALRGAERGGALGGGVRVAAAPGVGVVVVDVVGAGNGGIRPHPCRSNTQIVSGGYNMTRGAIYRYILLGLLKQLLLHAVAAPSGI